MSVIRSYDAVISDQDRSAAVYARVLEDIQSSFAKHSKDGTCCFDDQQKSCIEDIALHISMLFDTQSHQPKSEVFSFIKHVRQMPVFKRWGIYATIIGGAAVCIVNMTQWIYSGYNFMYPKPIEATAGNPPNQIAR